MAEKRRRATDLTVRLVALDDLFRTPEPDQFPTTGRLVSGVDELIDELRARRLTKHVRTTILLGPDADPADETAVADLIRRYCDLRLRDLDVRLRGQRRDVRRATMIGVVLFVLGVGLSGEFAASYWPAEVRSLLGEGVFLVLAWVGLWYPLDYVVFGRRPLVRERKVLLALRATVVTIAREPAAR